MLRIPRSFAAALALAAASLAFTTADAPVVHTAQYFISAGCPEDTPGTCTSTRWLGDEPGDATSNFVTAITPVDEVLFRAEGSLNWRDYPTDGSVSAAHLSGDAIQAVVSLAASGAGVQTTVHGQLRVRIDGKSKTLVAEPQTVNLLPTEETPVTLTFDVAQFGGLLLTNPIFEVAVHGVNVNAGHINQQGGSTLTIPYIIPEEEPAATS